MTKKTGVYICECGPNIKDALDMEELINFASRLRNVVLAKSCPLLCSEEGRKQLKDEIKEKKLDCVVIAGCSPREHEITFMKAVQDAGLNPYMIQIANIREHCTWTIPDRAIATEKAKVIIRMAVNRVLLHQPLEKREIDCIPDAMVIGAGVAGIEAALVIAQSGRKVYLVDKAPCIGGKVAGYEDTFPGLECAPCMLEPKLAEILHNDNIQLLTYSEVEEVLGFLGNFIVKVRKKARSVDLKACIGCGACIEACPVKVNNEYEKGLNDRKAIYTPFAGSLPNVPVIDRENCLKFKNNDECEECKKACLFNAVDLEQNDELLEIKVGGIILATGFDLFDPRKMPRYGYGKIDDIYTAAEASRILNSDGPTGGKVVLKNGKTPKSVAVIHCVGSNNKKFVPYCSGVCCMYSATFMHLIKEKLPEVDIIDLRSNLVSHGKGYREFCNKVMKKDISVIQTAGSNCIKISKNKHGITVRYETGSEKIKKVSVDMVILSPAIIPNKDMSDLAEVFDIALDDNGFFAEEHGKLAPVTTTTGGIFIAGCCQGPKDIQSSVAQGAAAAGKILSLLVPGKKLELEAMTSKIDDNLCSGCKICIPLCPYKAITFNDEKKTAEINDILCRGCGTCAAACPGGAAKAAHFSDQEILTEIREALR
jgi:heterodisulfide reductase subunit A2